MEQETRLKEISKIESKCDFVLPEDYINFLIQNEGYSNGSLSIYDISELEETNRYMEIGEYAKEYIAIGDDGAGLVFLMKQERLAKEVIISDMGDLNVNEPYQIIDNLQAWITDDFPINEEYDETSTNLSDLVDIVLINLPDDGKKSILKIKKGLNLEYSIKDLLDITKKTPVVLKNNVTRVKAQRLTASTGYSDFFELKKNDCV